MNRQLRPIVTFLASVGLLGNASAQIFQQIDLTFPAVAPSGTPRYGGVWESDGDVFVVGNPDHDGADDQTGAVYVYDRFGTHLRTLTNPGANAVDRFGHSVAVYGDVVTAGSYLSNDLGVDAGLAFLHRLSSPFTQTTIAPPGVATGHQFGLISVTVNESYTAISAPLDDHGVVYLIGSDPVKAIEYGSVVETFRPSTSLIPSGSDGGSNFGLAMSASEPLINPPREAVLAVGAPLDDSGAINAGAVYVYIHENGTDPSQASFSHKIVSHDPTNIWQLGRRLLVTPDRIYASAVKKSDGSGAVYTYEIRGTSPIDSLVAPSDVNGRFGARLLRFGDYVIANSLGKAYVYDSSASLVATLSDPNTPADTRFGVRMAALGDTLLLGSEETVVAYVVAPTGAGRREVPSDYGTIQAGH